MTNPDQENSETEHDRGNTLETSPANNVEREVAHDIFTRERRRTALDDDIFPKNKEAVFTALAEGGITKIEVEFDGGGDDGQLDDLNVLSGETRVPLPASQVALLVPVRDYLRAEIKLVPLREAVEELLYGLLNVHARGWEINDGSFGEFVLDVEAKTITLDFNIRISDVESSSWEW